MENNGAAAKPLTVDVIDVAAFDTLEAAPAVEVAARSLRAGMVLLDPAFDTPAAVIDHRNRAARGSGAVRLFILDLESRTYAETSIHEHATVRVMAQV